MHAAKAIGKEVQVRNSDKSKNGELKDRSIIKKNVSIGNNVFIGAKTLILPEGVLEENSIYAGNPCKKIGTIESFANRYEFLLEEI